MVLNPVLYEKLERCFGEVKIANEDEEMDFHYGYRATDSRKGKKRLIVHEDGSGEMYRVCCPFCNDTRWRLYINHRWGVSDKFGNRNLFLAYCQNEQCLHKTGRVQQLDERVRGMGLRGRNKVQEKIRPGVPPEERRGPNRETPPPGRTMPLTSLPDNHPAKIYLAERGFDPDEMGRLYKASYCDYSRAFPLAINRLVIPIYEGEKLVGWQARRLTKEPNPGARIDPKYYSCPGMKRSKLLYNWEQAATHSILVICEGPTDVWSFGPEAVAIFGKDASATQRRKIVEIGKDKPVIIMLDPSWDPEEQKIHHIEKLHRQLQPAIKRLVKVYLPDECDPGDLDRSFMVAAIKKAAKEQGVSFKKKKKKRAKV